MRLNTFVAGGILAVAIFLFAQHHPAATEKPLFKAAIDLTHTISENSPGFTEQEKFQARPVAQYDHHGYFAREIAMPEHFGTHVDAPAHFAQGRWTIDNLPAERLVRPIIVLDVSSKARSDADYRVSVEDIAAWEQVHGHIPPGTVVMARTGWDERWNMPQRYRNADGKGVPHFPGFSLEAARFLVEARDAVGIGIDTLSVDPGNSDEYPVHRYCAQHSVYHVENVANLAQVPPEGSLVVIAPMKLKDGSGAPARVLALIR